MGICFVRNGARVAGTANTCPMVGDKVNGCPEKQRRAEEVGRRAKGMQDPVDNQTRLSCKDRDAVLESP